MKSFKAVTSLVALTIMSIMATHAQSIDMQGMSPEDYVDNVLLPSFTEEIPDGADIDCSSESRFRYVKNIRRSYVLRPEFHEGVCESVAKYDSFMFDNLNQFWQISDDFGLEISLIQDASELNGAYTQRPILNRNTVPKFILFHYEGINYPLNAPIWSHEYGHAVLGRFIDEHFFPLSRKSLIEKIKYYSTGHEILTEVNKYTELQDNLYDKRDRLAEQREQARGDDNNDLANQLDKEYKQILTELAEADIFHDIHDNRFENLTNGYYRYISFFSSPYHEFFADVFAGLFYNDINVVGDNFDDLGSTSKKKSDYRRFKPLAHYTEAHTWTNYQTHHFFTPTRHFMGTLDLSVLNTEVKRKLFIRKLAEFILKDMRYLIDEAPPEDFFSYKEIENQVASATTYTPIKELLQKLENESKLAMRVYIDQFDYYCKHDFKACKETIVSELKLNKKGIFKFAPNIKKSNQRLSEAVARILSEF